MKKHSKIIFLFRIAVISLIILTGCSLKTSAPPDAPETDRAGNPITLPTELNRIVSLAPSATQTLIHLGLGDKLVAVDVNSLYIKELPENILTVDMIAPDPEQLLLLDADLILCSSMTNYDGSTPLKPLADAGACVAVIPSSNSIEGIRQDILFIADLSGQSEKGNKIISDLDSSIQEIKNAVGSAAPKSVYFEIAAAPKAYSFGSGTFMNEMIDIAGGVNIFADALDFIAVSEEQVIARNPEVIFTNVTYIDDSVGEILGRGSLSNVTAVTKGQVFFINGNDSSQPNENIVKAISEMARYLHPDLWTGN